MPCRGIKIQRVDALLHHEALGLGDIPAKDKLPAQLLHGLTDNHAYGSPIRFTVARTNGKMRSECPGRGVDPRVIEMALQTILSSMRASCLPEAALRHIMPTPSVETVEKGLKQVG